LSLDIAKEIKLAINEFDAMTHVSAALFFKEYVLLSNDSSFEESKSIMNFPQTINIGVFRQWLVATLVVLDGDVV
jgi:hypothetical protein